MKKQIIGLMLAGATALVFTGCSTTHHVTQWEYKVVQLNMFGVATADVPKTQESFMNALGKDGWIFVSQNDVGLCFKRPV